MAVEERAHGKLRRAGAEQLAIDRFEGRSQPWQVCGNRLREEPRDHTQDVFSQASLVQAYGGQRVRGAEPWPTRRQLALETRTLAGEDARRHGDGRPSYGQKRTAGSRRASRGRAQREVAQRDARKIEQPTHQPVGRRIEGRNARRRR